MKKETKIFVLIIVISVAVLTALDIQTKGKITSLLGSVNPMNLKSSDVPYTNNSQSNVQGAIDDLYEKATNAGGLDSSYIDFTTLATNTNKTILASSAGVCIKRNNKVSCMKKGNWNVEKDHIQQIFSDVGAYNSSTGLGCYVNSSNAVCIASDFYCNVYDDSYVNCRDKSDSSYCNVSGDGSVYCN